MLDRKRPYAVTYGETGTTFYQDGIEYDNYGKPLNEQPNVEAHRMSQSERMKDYWKKKKAAQ